MDALRTSKARMVVKFPGYSMGFQDESQNNRSKLLEGIKVQI